MKISTIRFIMALGLLLPASPLRAQCHEYETWRPQGDPITTYGNSIAVDGEWAAIGASQDYSDNNGVSTPWAIPSFKTGSVFIRRFVGGEWVDTQKIHCPDGNTFGGDEFGFSVALQGTTLMIGAPNHELPYGHRGAVYVYQEADAIWRLVHKITPFDPLGREVFGWSVGLDGNIAAFGAIGVNNSTGLVYVYQRINRVWTQVAQVRGADTHVNDRLGSSLSVQGTSILAGARDAQGGLGGAWIFEQVDGQWLETARLRPSAPAPGDKFGQDVCLVNDEALVSGQMAEKGRVYVFPRIQGAWQETEDDSFTSSDGTRGNHGFGVRIVADGQVALIAAPRDNQIPDGQGSAYLYHREPEGWIQGPKIRPIDPGVTFQFAWAIELSGGVAFAQSQIRRFEGNSGEVLLADNTSCWPLLEVTPTCPSGGWLYAEWSHATPHGAVALFFSPQLGQSPIPPGNPCQGIMLDLDPINLTLFYSGDAGPLGTGSIRREAARGACGGFMQLLDIPSCATSNTQLLE